MKYLILLIIIAIVPLEAQQPEIYIVVSDYWGGELWYIRATAISYIYDENYNYTTDYTVAEEYAPDPQHTLTGFDFSRFDQGGEWQDISHAKYRFDFSQSLSDPVLFSFNIDFRSCFINFQDIYIYFYNDADHIISVSWKISNLTEQHFISNETNLNYWEMVEYSYDPTCFNANIYLHNYINSETNDIEDYGEMFADNIAYTSGIDIFTALKGTTHNFRSYTTPVSNENYLFRNWSSTVDKYLNPKNLKITNNDDVEAYLYPTQSLTVTNYLEGGTSTDDFQLTWQNILPPENYDYGIHYDAFTYQDPINDKYTIEALPITAQRYSTNWTFLNWNTGSTSTTLQNIKVPATFPQAGLSPQTIKGISLLLNQMHLQVTGRERLF